MPGPMVCLRRPEPRPPLPQQAACAPAAAAAELAPLGRAGRVLRIWPGCGWALLESAGPPGDQTHPSGLRGAVSDSAAVAFAATRRRRGPHSPALTHR